MGEDNFKLGAGSLYINGEKFTEISEAEFTTEPSADDLSVLSRSFSEVSFSTELVANAFTRFIHAISGITQYLKDICPNKRVVHLAFHAKKERTRKKNYGRMIRICERMNKR